MSFESCTIQAADVAATVIPTRGALVSRLTIRDVSLLYLDESTIDDCSKSVRGGIPVLFPFAGSLRDDLLVESNTTVSRHGFARNMPWVVSETGNDTICMQFASTPTTRVEFPFDFCARQSVVVDPNGMRIELDIANNGDTPMPVSPGWHPYFRCPASAKNRLRSDLDALRPSMLGNEREFDFGLPFPCAGEAAFRIPDLGEVVLSVSPEIRHLQFWSQPGKNFICIEPFLGPNDTINTERRLTLPPGARRTLWMQIAMLPTSEQTQ